MTNICVVVVVRNSHSDCLISSYSKNLCGVVRGVVRYVMWCMVCCGAMCVCVCESGMIECHILVSVIAYG